MACVMTRSIEKLTDKVLMFKQKQQLFQMYKNSKPINIYLIFW
jgi:hypothetical protein